MRQFDFYEFAGVLAPGALALVGLSIVHPDLRQLLKEHAFSVGDFGIFLILSYAAGHLMQGIGNFIETAWWTLWGGWPTDWPRRGKQAVLSKHQMEALEGQVNRRITLPKPISLAGLGRGEWFGITRQIHATVQSEGRAGRVYFFNGNYGLCRGMAAALLLIVTASMLVHGKCWWQEDVLLVAFASLAIYRMHRFGKHYARELFVQFLELPGRETDAHETRPRVS